MALPAADESLWLRRFHPRPNAAVRLVCLPHAGGAASSYAPLSALLPPSIQALAVQYPGRQDRRHDTPLESVHELARAVFEALRPSADQGPLALFGHSMGASVGFEVARLMEDELGVVPAVLFASGRPAPSLHRSLGIHRMDDAGIIAELQAVSGTDDRVLDNAELLRLTLPSLRSDYKAAETYRYRPGPKLGCDIVGLTGDGDNRVSIEEVAAWKEHTAGSFTLQVFPGGHFYLQEQKAAVAGVLTDTLRAATRTGGHPLH
ncbi:thioesterase II family protein [Streptomyces sp. SCSIO ZS0520]|uniref:thioesterase II family protein n=1 Tax=Streptomyces sp. SCSIO ZS0520 TaxID=2892996 RepID=UPI0021D9EECF|nr:alpha/beta fold hydrolase [Streptomyces sp. SCSIO ZS0520]